MDLLGSSGLQYCPIFTSCYNLSMFSSACLWHDYTLRQNTSLGMTILVLYPLGMCDGVGGLDCMYTLCAVHTNAMTVLNTHSFASVSEFIFSSSLYSDPSSEQQYPPAPVGQGREVLPRTPPSDPYSSGAGWNKGVEGIPKSVQPRLKLWFVKLALESQGILYEDTVIRWWWLLYL